MQQLLLIDEVSDDLMYPTLPNISDDEFCYQDIESELEAYLETELGKFEPMEIVPITVSDINCKWKFSSALQKSIRRGYSEDAVRYAMVFHSLDATAFWVRLVVISYEEIGMGGVMELALTLIAARSSRWRKKVGEVKVLQFIVKMLAEAVKDRSCCDYMQVLWYHPRKYREMNALRTATQEELSGFALSERNTTSFRTCSAWLLAGTDRFENKQLPLRSGSREKFCNIVEQMKIPAIVKYITIRGMTACRYPMPLVYPFLWQMKEKSLYINVERTTFPVERYYIGGLPSESWDQYVREGKKSFAYFSKACEPVNEWFTSKRILGSDARVAAIGAAVFIMDGALLDRRLVFEGASEIYDLEEKYDYENVGLSLGDGRELARLIEANSDILRQSRIRVVVGERK